MITLKDLRDKIEKRISDYIEFDVKELFAVSDYITIYGGAVRDSLAGLEIHDIDILCMPDSAYKLRKFLKDKYNYETLELYDQDTLNMYHGISMISEPWTLMNDNKKIIQIIRPMWKGEINPDTHRMNQYGYQQAYRDLIKNVDLSCCGVFLENHGKELMLMEACKDGIIHCLSKTFVINEWSKLYNSNRTLYREHKLSSRGWNNLNELGYYSTSDEKNKLKKQRVAKICTLEFTPEYDYKVWTEEEYLTRPNTKEEDFFA